jgi:hypothetical protein
LLLVTSQQISTTKEFNLNRLMRSKISADIADKFCGEKLAYLPGIMVQ